MTVAIIDHLVLRQLLCFDRDARAHHDPEPDAELVEQFGAIARGVRRCPGFFDLEGVDETTFLQHENPVGKRVADAFFGPTLENVLGCYQSVVDRREPYLDDDYYLRDGDYFADEANIFLPLSNDGEHVNMILVYTAYRRVR